MLQKKKILTIVGSIAIAAYGLLVANELLDPFQYYSSRNTIRERRSLSLLEYGELVSPSSSFVFDANSVKGKSYLDAGGLQPDGTYLLLHDEFHRGPNEFCMPMIEAQDAIQRVHYHFDQCKLFDDMFGNRVAYLYGIKMVAYAMRKPFTFTCGMAEGENPLGAAYFMKLNVFGDMPGPVPNRNGKEYTAEEVCQDIGHGRFCSWNHQDLDVVSDAMIADWKYLASPDVVSISDYDDAVIHLRLGDGLYSTVGGNEGKGVFPHATYVNLLKQAEKEKGIIKTIGIVTAPFKGAQLRAFDRGSTSVSEMVANDLIDTLQKSFPGATVRLLNSPDSSIIESLARLVHARKVAVCGCSTFCPFAVLAADGIGYMYNPAGQQNGWVRNAAEWHPNFRLFDTPMLNGLVISNNKNGYQMPDSRLLRWLREQDPNVGNIDIYEAPIFRTKGLDTAKTFRAPRVIEKVKPSNFSPAHKEVLVPKALESMDRLQQDGTYFLSHDELHQVPNKSCMPMVEQQDRITRVHYHFSQCNLFDDMFGTHLGYVYGIKMMAYAMHKPFTFTCGLAEGESPHGAAFLMQLNSDVAGPVPNRNGLEYTAEEICQGICDGGFCNWNHQNLDLASDAMIADWKYLSSPNIAHISDHDDAVIHLRLGDGLYSTFGTNEGKGVFPHATYINLLKQAEEEKGVIKTIGIVTAPFKGSKLRVFDRGNTPLSERIALELIHALHGAFPDAEIRLHNSPDGTIIESMSRLVHARKVAVCGCSTFCPYAVLATDGIGYIYNPLGALNIWARNAADRYDNIRLFDTPMLNGLMIANAKTGRRLPQSHLISWMRKQDPNVGNVDIYDGEAFVYK